MLVKELVNTCCNMGVGQIRIINKNNYEDNYTVYITEHGEKYHKTSCRYLINWEFVPKKQIGTIEWDFILEILV